MRLLTMEGWKRRQLAKRSSPKAVVKEPPKEKKAPVKAKIPTKSKRK